MFVSPRGVDRATTIGYCSGPVNKRLVEVAKHSSWTIFTLKALYPINPKVNKPVKYQFVL